MARTERTRSPRNGGASAGQRAVRSRPRSALRQDQPTPPDQAEFVLCEQTILAMSRPTVVTCRIPDAPRAGGPFTTSTPALRCLSGRRPSYRNGPATKERRGGDAFRHQERGECTSPALATRRSLARV